MANAFCGLTANDVWKDAFAYLKAKGKQSISREGDTQEILHVLMTIEDPRQRWVYDRFPSMSIAFALAEIIWILNGTDESEVINEWNPLLSSYAGNGDRYYGAYGKRIRKHYGFDQLERTYYALQSVPESRQVVIQIYDTEIDMPLDDGKPRSQDIPCNICSMLKIRDEKLEWSQIMRSNDIFRGMPYNFIQFTTIQEIMAGWLGLDVGAYSHYCDSLHLYEKDYARISNNGLDANNDILGINKLETDQLIKEIYERMKCLCNKKVDEKTIAKLAFLNSEHVAYNNMMLIIAAYIAQRRKFNVLAEELVHKSTNVLYQGMWQRWKEDRGYS
ncbi:MAG: hypothetical protein IJV15_14265 [Lachnospiraceae bacterium]|nr:hypothetical protein [Lachnospiraceae bacterium]MBR1598635.1 hypothetical protein [Lachnospiraceae bacterium]